MRIPRISRSRSGSRLIRRTDKSCRFMQDQDKVRTVGLAAHRADYSLTSISIAKFLRIVKRMRRNFIHTKCRICPKGARRRLRVRRRADRRAGWRRKRCGRRSAQAPCRFSAAGRRILLRDTAVRGASRRRLRQTRKQAPPARLRCGRERPCALPCQRASHAPSTAIVKPCT